MSLGVAEILKAKTWRNLNVERSDIKLLRKQFHPDVNKDPQAHDAFVRLNELFGGPDFGNRYASATKDGSHTVWRPKPGFEDLQSNAVAALRQLSKSKEPMFFPTLSGVDNDYFSVRYGSGWYLLSDFNQLDDRTLVWIAKRAAAALIYAGDLVHGDINESNIFINPRVHGLMLDSWQASVKVGQRLICKPAFAPPAYLGGKPADHNLSVSQVVHTLTKFGPFDKLLQQTLNEVKTPEELLKQIDRAAQRLFGSPKFHELNEPKIGEI